MAEYTVTIRDEADIKTLEQWAKDQFRAPVDQLNAEIRKLLQQYAKTTVPGQPRVAGRRGPLPKAA